MPQAVALKDGRQIDADLVVVAAGVRPNIELAHTADLAINRGIMVDDHLQTSKPVSMPSANARSIAAFATAWWSRPMTRRTRWPPILRAGRRRYTGSVLATNLKVSGVNVFSAGDFLGVAGTEQIVLSDPGLGSYKKLVIADGRLTGAVLFGDTADGLWYLDHIRSGTSIEAIREDIVFGRALAERQGGVRGGRCRATSPPIRSAISKASRPASLRRARSAASFPPAASVTVSPPVPMQFTSRRRIAWSRRAESLPTRKNSSASSIRSTPMSDLKQQAANNEPPKPADNFRWRFYGLFYTSPAQNAYMCRLRIPNGILKHWQLAGLADLAERYAHGYSHVTTRANLQMREIEPKHAVLMVEAIQDLGLCSRGSGADNIRNVTGTPTAGIDPQELIDTRPYAREWHFHILNERALYGLPRKFNVGFDGGGRIPVLEDTNDIGFQAVEVKEGFGAESGVWFRLALGGITGHKDFARDTGVIVKPAEATQVADAVVRVYIEHGDRTDRAKARLKYVLDAWGMEKFIAHVEEKLGRKLVKVPLRRSRRGRSMTAARISACTSRSNRG